MEPHLSNRTWIFQANPDKFDVDGYLSSGLTKITWSVKQFRKEITPGDYVFIWRASGKKKSPAGIIAATTVLSEPWKGIDHPEAEAFWNESYEQKTGVHVWLSLEKHANSKEVLKRDWLKDDPICHDLTIFKQTRATNFKVTPKQEARLMKMWQRTGVSWDRSDLVAGLWAYYKTYGKPVSKKAESPVSDVAIKIGRAVGGVYSKLMNLRYIDPRHEHGGLSSVGKLDREIWSEFFNKQNNEIDHKALEDEFNRLWSSFWSPGDLESYKENLDDQTLALQKLSQNELLNRINGKDPNALPRVGQATQKVFERDPLVAAYVKKRAGAKCEIPTCKFKLFIKPDGKNYVEIHHIKPLSEGGLDHPDNVACLCPMHHREVHYGKDCALLKNQLLDIRKERH